MRSSPGKRTRPGADQVTFFKRNYPFSRPKKSARIFFAFRRFGRVKRKGESDCDRSCSAGRQLSNRGNPTPILREALSLDVKMRRQLLAVSPILLQRKSSEFISNLRSRQSGALGADSQLEKGRSPPRPSGPLGSGGTDSALRLVTCWSSDALRLSSLGRTRRKLPPQAAARHASPSSS
jgi:hypothetical protein